MLLSNHSYGYLTPPDEWYGAYLTDARDYDEIMYNAPYYLQVVAAGNDGASGTVNENPLDGNALYDKLSGMATSKNNITKIFLSSLEFCASSRLLPSVTVIKPLLILSIT